MIFKIHNRWDNSVMFEKDMNEKLAEAKKANKAREN